MAKYKIAFVVAIPMTARVFLLYHIVNLMQKYEVHLITNYDGQAELKMEFENMGIICHHVPIQRKINLIKDLKVLYLLYRLFKKEGFISVHSVTPKAGLLTAIGGWSASVLHRIHIFTGQVWATRKGIMQMMLKTMDKVIVLLDTNLLVDGEGQRQFLIKEGILSEKNSLVLANGSIAGIKLDKFVISADIRNEERKRLGLSDEKVVYIFLGRLNHDKGIGEIFKAFNKLVLDCSQAVLLFYGVDEEGYDKKVVDYPNIKRGVNYFFPGLTKTPYKSLQAGDVFVLPSWREGFGVSVLEAQALGIPVITSDCYGVIDASKAGETGLRCGVGDVDGLYQCMKEYYKDSNLRLNHGRAGRMRVEKLFDNTLVSKAWVDFYEDMLKNA